MRKLGLLSAAACCVSAHASARANSPFDGVWVADLDTQSGLARDVYLVADGNYSCATCEPPRSYRADAKPHRVPGDPDVVSESVSITGPRTIVTHIVAQSLDCTTTMTVADDDQTATYVSLDHRPGISGVLRTVYLARRTARTLAGTHPVSGTWQGIRYVEVPKEVWTTVLRVSGNRFSYSTPLGSSFTTLIGGGYVPLKVGGDDGTTVSVRRTAQRKIKERMKQAGKLIWSAPLPSHLMAKRWISPLSIRTEEPRSERLRDAHLLQTTDVSAVWPVVMTQKPTFMATGAAA